ncbi:MAG TPA: MFS transporter [Thermoleophilaceae bacterium]|jgi:MFS family permease
MNATRNLLRREPRARVFFAAYAQSALGNGAGYVALVVVAYERWASPWAIALVLMADFVPAMLLGPVFGAAADRWSRRRVAIAADLIRAVAFVGVALVGGFAATVAFALLAGAGAATFTPAILASLPSLVEEKRLPAATSLYGALTDAGRTLGPAVVALALAFAGAELLAVANGLSFLISAAVLAALRFGDVREPAGDDAAPRPGLLREATEGVRATVGLTGIRVLVLASSGLLMFAAMLNIAELLVAEDLGSGETGYSILVGAAGLGFVAGSLSGAAGAEVSELKRRYLSGICVTALGVLLFGLAPAFVLAIPALALTGVGNGMMLVNERLIFQRVVPDGLMARAFALADAAGSWALAIAFVVGGVLVATLGTQMMLLAAGVGVVGVWALAAWMLRGTWTAPAPYVPERAPAAVEPA